MSESPQFLRSKSQQNEIIQNPSTSIKSFSHYINQGHKSRVIHNLKIMHHSMFLIYRSSKFEPVTSSTQKSLKLSLFPRFSLSSEPSKLHPHLSAVKPIVRGDSLEPTAIVASAIKKQSFLEQRAVHMYVQATYSRTREKTTYVRLPACL